MLSEAMCERLLEIFKGEKKNRKIVKVIVDSLQEQLFRTFFSETLPTGTINRRIRINCLKAEFDESQKKILNALEKLLGEYDETFDKSYMNHSSELENFISIHLKKLIKAILELDESTHPELLEYIR